MPKPDDKPDWVALFKEASACTGYVSYKKIFKAMTRQPETPQEWNDMVRTLEAYLLASTKAKKWQAEIEALAKSIKTNQPEKKNVPDPILT